MCARKNTIEFRKTKKNELYASKTQLNEEKQWNVQRCAAKQGEKHGKNKNGEVWFETQEKFENIPSFYLTWLGLIWQIQFSSIHSQLWCFWPTAFCSSLFILSKYNNFWPNWIKVTGYDKFVLVWYKIMWIVEFDVISWLINDSNKSIDSFFFFTGFCGKGRKGFQNFSR